MTTADNTISPPAESDQAATNASVAGATGILALGNIASRIVGLARETVISDLFGATGAVDAFNVAIIVPKALFDLLIGGHVNSAIIPVLSEVVTLKGREELWRLVSVLLTLVTAALALLVVGIELFAPQIIQLTAAGFDTRQLSLATDLLRLTAPALIFMALFAVASGALYTLRSFTWPAFASTVFNGCIVLITLLFAPQLQPTPIVHDYIITWTQARPAHGITIVAVGWLIGAVLQLALQFPGLLRTQFRLTIHWRHPAIRRIAALYAPVMFSLVLDTLVIRTFSYNLASQTGAGSIAYMNWATTLVQFPQGLVATAISIAILPTLARQAALIATHGAQTFKDTLGLGLRLTITLILPATIGLFVLANPIIALIFEHGAFDAQDTVITALALRLYLIGLPFAALDLLLVYAFYARQDTLTPALIGILSLSIYMIVALVLLPDFGLFSLMIADSVKHLIHAGVSAYLLMRRMDGFGGQRLIVTASKTGVATLVMGVVGVVTLPLLVDVFGTHGLLRETTLVIAAAGVSGIVFLALALLLKIDELRWLVSLLRSRFRRDS